MLLNKQIKAVYDDGGQYPSKKEGLVLNEDDKLIMIELDSGQVIGLGKNRIIRIEIKEDSKHA